MKRTTTARSGSTLCNRSPTFQYHVAVVSTGGRPPVQVNAGRVGFAGERSVGMSELSEVERDAQLAALALARMSSYVRARRDHDDPAAAALADEGVAAAARVLAYLRDVRGNGDGAATAYPVRLGPWREWCPPRGHLLEDPGRQAGGRRWRGDPGE